MPPKSKRGKSNAQGGDVDSLEADGAQELLASLTQGSLTLQQVLQLAKADAPRCDGQCKDNKKGNPNCLCGLTPAEGSFRKKGLWQKEPSVLSNLGPDPNLLKLQDPTLPRGLNNLGNTCYVNSALQVLFTIPSFRRGLYELEPSVATQPIVSQLRDVFLALDFGPKYSVDLTAFAKSLSLDHSIQQDGSEFFKLLLGKLETILVGSSSKDIAKLIPHLFRGTFSWRTVCKDCNRPSESSFKATEFYELPLQVKGSPGLVASMTAALEAEILSGSNQYACDYCMHKADATRQMALRSVPPYLCLPLQRFVYDYKKGDKVKASDRFAFPLTLDLPSVLAAVTQDDGHSITVKGPGPDGSVGQYELVAVLVHKGNSASHGHYVAHIRDNGGTWWRYDDEKVTKMGPAPTGSADHGAATTSTPGASGASKAKKGGGKGGRGRGGGSRGGKGVSEADDEEEEGVQVEEVDGEGEDSDGLPGAVVFKSSTRDDEDWDPEEELQASGSKRGGRGKGRGGSRGVSRGRGAGKGRRGSSSRGGSRGGRGRGKKRGRGDEFEEEDTTEEEEEVEVGGSGVGEGAADVAGLTEEEQLAIAMQESLEAANGVGAAGAGVAAEVGAGVAAEPTAAAGKGRGRRAAAAGLTTTVAAAGGRGGKAGGAKGKGRNVAQAEAGDAAEQQPQELQVPGDVTAEVPSEAPAGAEGEPGPSTGKGAAKKIPTEIVSSNAYMLLYRHIGWQEPPPPASVDELPASAKESVASLVQEHETACEEYARRKQEAVKRVDERQKEVKSILAAAPAEDPATAHWLSLVWLQSWVDSEDSPGPIDNAPLLCPHGKLDPGKTAAGKLVSGVAWHQLQATHGGGPELTSEDICRECIKLRLQRVVHAGNADNTRKEAQTLLEATRGRGAGGGDDDELDTEDSLDESNDFWVARTWLSGWCNRKGDSIATDASPTTIITCPHGHLHPQSKGKRIAVPQHMWDFLCYAWTTALEAKAAKQKQQQEQKLQKQLAQQQQQPQQKVGTSFGSAANGDRGAVVEVVLDDDDDDDDVMIVSDTEGGHKHKGAGGSAKAQQAPSTPGANGKYTAVAGNGHTAVDVQLDASGPLKQEEEKGGAGTDAAVTEAPGAGVEAGAQLPPVCIPLPVATSQECMECAESLGLASAQRSRVRREVEDERQQLGNLAADVLPALELTQQYALVPRAWLRSWQVYVNQGPVSRTKHSVPIWINFALKQAGPQGVPRPGPLPDALAACLCPCHPDKPLLKIRPPVVASKRNKYSQASPETDELVAILPEDFWTFMRLYGGMQELLGGAQGSAPQVAEAQGAAKTRGRKRRQADGLQQEEEQQQGEVVAAAAAAQGGGEVAGMSPAEVAIRQQGITAYLMLGSQPPVSVEQQQHVTIDLTAAQAPVADAGQVKHEGKQQNQQQKPEVVCIEEEDHHPVGQQQHQPINEADAAQAAAATAEEANGKPASKRPRRGATKALPPSQAAQQQADKTAAGADSDIVMVEVAAGTGAAQQGSTGAAANGGNLVLKATPSAPGVAGTAAAAAVPPELLPLSQQQPTRTTRRGARSTNRAVEALLREGLPDSDQEVVNVEQEGTGATTVAAAAADLANGASAVGTSGSGGAGGADVPYFMTIPEPCGLYLRQTEEEAKRRALTYEMAEIMVELVTKEELQGLWGTTAPAGASAGAGGQGLIPGAPAWLSLGGSVGAGTERRSRRARKGRQPINMSSSGTLRELKLNVFQVLGVHPGNVQLYARGPRLLDGPEGTTLAELEVYPGEELRVVSLGIHDDNDIASVFASAGRPGGKRELEMGFKNTALLSSAPVPAAAATGAEGSGSADAEAVAAAASEGDAGGGGSAGAEADAQDVKVETQGQ